MPKLQLPPLNFLGVKLEVCSCWAIKTNGSLTTPCKKGRSCSASFRVELGVFIKWFFVCMFDYHRFVVWQKVRKLRLRTGGKEAFSLKCGSCVASPSQSFRYPYWIWPGRSDVAGKGASQLCLSSGWKVNECRVKLCRSGNFLRNCAANKVILRAIWRSQWKCSYVCSVLLGEHLWQQQQGSFLIGSFIFARFH